MEVEVEVEVEGPGVHPPALRAGKSRLKKRFLEDNSGIL
jgi:hypothetical protein